MYSLFHPDSLPHVNANCELRSLLLALLGRPWLQRECVRIHSGLVLVNWVLHLGHHRGPLGGEGLSEFRIGLGIVSSEGVVDLDLVSLFRLSEISACSLELGA